jgi:hypothetical protein
LRGGHFFSIDFLDAENEICSALRMRTLLVLIFAASLALLTGCTTSSSIRLPEPPKAGVSVGGSSVEVGVRKP